MSSQVAVPAAAGAAVSSYTQRTDDRSVGRSLWWFVVPAVVVYLYVVIVPSSQGLYLSFTSWSSLPQPTQFIGWENYVTILQGDAGRATFRTVLIAFTVVVLQNVLGLALALLLNGKVFGRNVLRTIIFAPLVISPLVVGYLFKYLFGAPRIGGINSVLSAVGLKQVDFLGSPTIALWIIVISIVWQFTGSTMVIYLAGLQNVPEELNEAAALDGASYWQRFWYVTRPLLAPAFTVNLMLGLIGGLKLFDQIFAITGGGPGGTTHTISTLIYRMYSQFGQFGQAVALAMVLTVAVGILSFIQYTVLRRQERAV